MTKNTVYVIGAGASKEAGLPTGKELKDEISHLFTYNDERGHFDIDIADAYAFSSNSSSNINSLYLAAKKIGDGLSQTESIDNFIHRHRDDEEIALCGKLAIVKSILAAEKNSHFYIESPHIKGTIDYDKLVGTWYISFFQSITKGCTIGQLKDRFEYITLIIFNYDRCVEHFLYSQLIKVYGCTKDQAAELVNNIKIYHPYGDVGSLPWRKGMSDTNRILNFAEKPSHNKLFTLAQGIKTFTEGNNPGESNNIQIRTHMAQADRVVFLGFAFDTLNMQLIEPTQKHPSAPDTKCFATVFEESINNANIYSNRISKLFRGRSSVEIGHSKCGAFFEHYRESLSFSDL